MKTQSREERVQATISEILAWMGDDPAREGLKETPRRVMEAWRFFTSGYHQDAGEILKGAAFTQDCDEMVIVKDIEVYSLCEHHLLPFIGRCHVAYLPDRKIIGLSKIARIVEVYSRRLQVQERLTLQIAQALQEGLNPKGVAVIIEAKHLCMVMRGVQKQHSEAVTSAMLGLFKKHQRTRNEFLQLIKKPG